MFLPMPPAAGLIVDGTHRGATSPRAPVRRPFLPSGRAAWGIYALVAIILALSSVAPFVQLGRGGPSVAAADLWTAALDVVLWVPFVALLAWVVRGARRGAHAALSSWIPRFALLLVPPLHALSFVLVEAALDGAPTTVAEAIGSVPFQVLTLLGTLQFLVLVAVLLAVSAGREADESRIRAAELELEASQLESRLARAHLDALSAQLHPHFLFNTLNSISVLAGTDGPSAQRMVRQLSTLLRAVLVNGDQPTVALAQEIALLQAYVDIQCVRFGDRLRVDMDVDPDVLPGAVPTLILQPLVENAIHHAVSDRDDGGHIVVSARRQGDMLVVEVRDDGTGHGDAASAVTASRDTHRDATEGGSGIGHRNTRERLRHLYGSHHRFDVTYGEGRGGCTVHLEIPWLPAPGARS